MAASPRYLLVIQTPVESTGDFDRLVESAERIDALLKDIGRVQGHEAGTGVGNLHILTDQPQIALQKALPCLDERVRDDAKAAYREVEGEAFTILWPPGLTEFRC